MLVDPNSDSMNRLNSIERRLEEMVERKWKPLWEEQDSDPMEVWIEENRVCIEGEISGWGDVLLDDVIRTLDRGHYKFYGGKVFHVYPISASRFHEVSGGVDVRPAAVYEALNKTGIHVPFVVHTGFNKVWMRCFETRMRAEEITSALEVHIKASYEKMGGENVEGFEIKEFEEPREWLPPESWYAIAVKFE